MILRITGFLATARKKSALRAKTSMILTTSTILLAGVLLTLTVSLVLNIHAKPIKTMLVTCNGSCAWILILDEGMQCLILQTLKTWLMRKKI